MGIESLLPESVKLIVMGVIAGVFVLSAAARHYPAVEWLQAFRFRDHITNEQRAKASVR